MYGAFLEANMRIYFYYNGKEVQLHQINICDDWELIEVETSDRFEDLKRGCVGDLVISVLDDCGHEVNDVFRDCLLRNINLSDSSGETYIWKYTFLKF